MHKDLVREGEVATYHCWSRCVQRSFLYGDDPLTGRNLNYRRGWAEDLLAYQALVSAIDMGNYSLLSNPAHNIMHTRPRHCPHLVPRRAGPPLETGVARVSGRAVGSGTDGPGTRGTAGRAEKLEKIRRDLTCLSWFMARGKSLSRAL